MQAHLSHASAYPSLHQAHGGASAAGELKSLQMELDDMREAKEKAEGMLARMMGQG